MKSKKQLVSVIAIAGSALVSSTAAIAIAHAQSGPARVYLNDVQIGERREQTRIAFICDGPCPVIRQANGDLILSGVEENFDLDFSARGARISSMRASTRKGGALLRFDTVAKPISVRSKDCTIGGQQASCVDLFFDLALVEASSTKKPAQKVAAAATAKKTPTIRQKKPAAKPAVRAAAPVEKPVLRESAAERYTQFAELAPPTRLQPAQAAILAKVQPIEQSVAVAKPGIRVETPLTPVGSSEFSIRARRMIGKNLSQSYCNNAKATLQADAWAIGAMNDIGFCAAARGDVEEGDTVFARLLDYSPDNYEALVGRAMIAELAGEKGVARKYYQDALNALPPIAHSNRIVEAMSALN